MNINFDKTDRLIELIEENTRVLSHLSWRAENSLQKKKPQLYQTLLDITASGKTEKQKQADRIKAFAHEYKLGKNLTAAEEYLKLEFDEKEFVQCLARAYWQLQSLVSFKDDTGRNFAEKEGFRKWIEKHYPKEPCIDIVVDVISRAEPRIKDIEQEFWSNCTNSDTINNFCNIYQERWNGHLKNVDEDYFNLDTILFDTQNELHVYFKSLRLSGLLQQRELYVEARIMGIAEHINCVSKELIRLLTSLRKAAEDNLSREGSVENELIEHADLINNFDSVSIQDVYAYFKAGLLDKRHLSKDELIRFIKYAFQERIIPAKKFVLQNVQSKQKIRTLFGNYYRSVAAKPYGKKKMYASLLGDYFEGETTVNVMANFSR